MFLGQAVPPPFTKGQAVIFFGGEVNLGRRMHWNPHGRPFANLSVMREADLRIVNLNCERARPEQINILADAHIDVVLTAETLAAQNNYLDRAGIFCCDKKSEPLFLNVNNIVVALLNLDVASDIREKISDARTKADIVLAALQTVDEEAGKLLIDCGADAVIGCRSKKLGVVETYKDRPIIYGAGDFLSDSRVKSQGNAFLLLVSKKGVEKVLPVPLIIDYCKTSLADKKLEGRLPIYKGNEKISPMTEPLPEWTAKKVPEDARIKFQQFGAVKLIGCRVQMSCVETWWTLAEPTDKDLTFDFGGDTEHQGCDWMFPTNRWKLGVIYYEKFALNLADDSSLKISVRDGKEELGTYIPAIKIQPQIQASEVGEFNIDDFKREFTAKRGEIFFMLRDFRDNASGLDFSALRRATLFKDYLGCEVFLLTHEYQNDLFEHFAHQHCAGKMLNMYDYFQCIDRDVEQPRRVYVEPMRDGWKIERFDKTLCIYRQDGTLVMYCVFTLNGSKLSFINFFDENQNKIRRDIYDELGFLSCRQLLDIESGETTEAFYYKPDGSLAIHELYDESHVVKLMEVTNGDITKTFNSHDEACSFWLFKLLNDKDKNYFIIGDRTPEWNQAYVDIKSAGLENVRVIHQLHNLHVLKPYDPATSKTKSRYAYLQSKNVQADEIITLTTRQRDDIIKRYGLDNVIVLPHSLVAVPRVTDVKLDSFKIVQVGRIVKDKGHAKAVEVMNRVIEKVPQATLHFYGNGSEQDNIQELINAAGLGEHIKFEGFSDNIPAVFASAALSILPSTFEGFPLVVQESLQQGCPVVAFDCNYGPADVIEDGVNGYLVPVDDVDAMADRIIKILTEQGLRDKLSANCAESIKKFSPEVVADKWARLFGKLLKGA